MVKRIMGQTELHIYSTVPEEHIKDEPEEKRYLVAKFLKEHKGEWFKSKIIARRCGYPARGTQVEVRKAITELITIDKLPIISSGRGFCYAKNKEMIQEYIESLESRVMGIKRRIKNLKIISVRCGDDSKGV